MNKELLDYIALQPVEIQEAVQVYLVDLQVMINENSAAAYLAIALIGASVE
jgi:hypothetical protein